jgi:hypothetical protein
MIEYFIIGGGILIALIGFIIGVVLVVRSYRESPSIIHYKRIIDILTLRRLWKRNIAVLEGDKKEEDPIKHYEDMRDKLTVRKKTTLPEEEIEESGGGLFARLVGGFIVILVGVSLIPTMANQVNIAKQNVTAAGSESMVAILNVIPYLFALTILMVAIMIVYGALRSSGMV